MKFQEVKRENMMMMMINIVNEGRRDKGKERFYFSFVFLSILCSGKAR